MQSAMFLLIVRPTPFLSRRLSKKIEWARRKPGSVSDNHLCWLPVTRKLMRPTYRAATGRRFFCPIWSCSEWGLHEKYVTISPCELLPHNFNLTTALPVSAECFCCTFPTVTCAGRYPAFLPCGARTFLIHPKDARDCLPYPKYKIQLFLEIYIIQTTFCKGELQLSAKQSIFLIFSNCSVFLLFSLLFLFYDDILKMYALYGVSLLFTKVISQIKEEQHQWN